MLGWLKQWVGGSAAAEPARQPAPASKSLPGRAMAQGASSAGALSVAPGSSAAVGSFGIQRPLVGAQGHVAGFEFMLPPAVAQRLAARGDAAALVAHSALLMGSMRTAALQGRLAVAELSASALARPGVVEQVADGAWLCLPDLARLPTDIATGLRQRGVRLGTCDGPPGEAPPADFIWLRASGDDADTLLLSAQRWQEARVRMPLVASGLAAVDDIERVLKAGFSLAGGRLSRRRSPANKPLNAAAHRICELLSHLAMNRDTVVVADAVRADVALSYRLLRYANSPALGFTRGVETVEQAVMLLGRRELARWLQMLLMNSANSRQATAAMQEQALARGRLLELLASAQPLTDEGASSDKATAGALFSVGLFSMLETLLETPLAVVLEPLRLSDAAQQALLHDQGPWAQHLQLATALDGGDHAAAQALSQRWGGMDTVQALSESAWSWAAAAAAGNTGGRNEKKPVT